MPTVTLDPDQNLHRSKRGINRLSQLLKIQSNILGILRVVPLEYGGSSNFSDHLRFLSIRPEP